MKPVQRRNRTATFYRLLWLCTLLLISAAPAAQSSATAAESDRFLAGQLLIATPEMKDPRFVETVIYMVKHNAEGAMGLVINKPLAKGSLDDLLKGFGVETKSSQRELVIHYGGPVGTRQGFLLHTDDTLLDSSTKVADGIAMTTDVGMLEAIGRGKGPRQWLFILGYAGWASGQLEMELKANSWFVIRGDKPLIFGGDADKKWRQAMDKRQIPL